MLPEHGLLITGDIGRFQKLCPAVVDIWGAGVLEYYGEKGRDLREVILTFGFVGFVLVTVEARDSEKMLIGKVGNTKVSDQHFPSGIR